MKPGSAQDGPPSAVSKYGYGSAGAESGEASAAGGKKRHAHHSDTLGIHYQGCGIEQGAAINDERYETQVAAEAAKDGGKSPHPGISAAAIPTYFFLHSYQLSAGRAENRSGSLSSKHFFIMTAEMGNGKS